MKPLAELMKQCMIWTISIYQQLPVNNDHQLCLSFAENINSTVSMSGLNQHWAEEQLCEAEPRTHWGAGGRKRESLQGTYLLCNIPSASALILSQSKTFGPFLFPGSMECPNSNDSKICPFPSVTSERITPHVMGHNPDTSDSRVCGRQAWFLKLLICRKEATYPKRALACTKSWSSAPWEHRLSWTHHSIVPFSELTLQWLQYPVQEPSQYSVLHGIASTTLGDHPFLSVHDHLQE